MTFKVDRQPPTIEINPQNDDIQSMKVWSYGDGEVFISQVEKSTGIEHLILIGPDAVVSLIDALQLFKITAKL